MPETSYNNNFGIIFGAQVDAKQAAMSLRKVLSELQEDTNLRLMLGIRQGDLRSYEVLGDILRNLHLEVQEINGEMRTFQGNGFKFDYDAENRFITNTKTATNTLEGFRQKILATKLEMRSMEDSEGNVNIRNRKAYSALEAQLEQTLADAKESLPANEYGRLKNLKNVDTNSNLFTQTTVTDVNGQRVAVAKFNDELDRTVILTQKYDQEGSLLSTKSQVKSDYTKRINEIKKLQEALDELNGTNISQDAVTELRKQLAQIDVTSPKAELGIKGIKKQIADLSTEASNKTKGIKEFGATYQKVIDNMNAKSSSSNSPMGSYFSTAMRQRVEERYGDKYNASVPKDVSGKSSEAINEQTASLTRLNTAYENTLGLIKQNEKYLSDYASKSNEVVKYQKEQYENSRKLATATGEEKKSFEANNVAIKKHIENLEDDKTQLRERVAENQLNIQSFSKENQLQVESGDRLDYNRRLNDLDAQANRKRIAAYQQVNSAMSKNMSLLDNISLGWKDATARILNYTVAYRVLWAVFSTLQNAVTVAKELNDAFTDIQMVTLETAESTNALRQEYSKLAKEMSATLVEVAQGATEWLNV